MDDADAAVITTLYTAFQALDGPGMAACYHPDAAFSDPVFQRLQGPQVGSMWKMLCGRAKGLEVKFSDVKAAGGKGSARWEARYAFGPAGRPVHNVIAASFELKEGKILRHTDQFDLYRWTRMALGPMGVLLGWSPLVQGKVRRQAMAGLDKYMGTPA